MNRSRLLAVFCTLAAFAQEPAPDVTGAWQGALEAGDAKLRLVLDISKASDGLYLGKLTSIDQGNAKMPVDAITVTGRSVHFDMKAINGAYEGSLDAAGAKLTGTWTQGGPALPLEFTRESKPAGPAAGRREDAAQARSFPFGLPLDMEVSIAPTPFSATDGKTHLAYELHITNFDVSGQELLLKRPEVLDGARSIASYEGASLNAILRRVGGPGDDKRVLDAGRRAIAWLWITLDDGARPPATLRHRITIGDQTVESSPVAVSQTKPLVIGPPLRGSNWVAANGPGPGSGHWSSVIPIDGKARIAQRFAIDWVQMGDEGGTSTGDEKDNRNYHAYGSDVLAVADGVVSAVRDGIPQNVPGPASRAVPITLETVGGNHVILDLGGGHFAFYAHFQPGSLRVKTGDRVKRGQVLGLVGNSGNSTEPHLHFHLTDANSPLASEGLPYLIDSFEVMKKDAAAGERHRELPLLNTRVRFPGPVTSATAPRTP